MYICIGRWGRTWAGRGRRRRRRARRTRALEEVTARHFQNSTENTDMYMQEHERPPPSIADRESGVGVITTFVDQVASRGKGQGET